MTAWYIISILGWLSFLLSARYLLHGRYCYCDHCRSGRTSIGSVIGIFTLVTLIFSGLILIETTRWYAVISFTLILLFFLEAQEGIIFWSQGPRLRLVRRWIYARD